MTARIVLTLLALLGFVTLLLYWLKQTTPATSQPQNCNGGRRILRVLVLQPLLNPLLRRLGATPVWLLPCNQEEIQHIFTQVSALHANLKQTLPHNSYLDNAKVQALTRQVERIPENICALAWKLQRLQSLHNIVKPNSPNATELEHLSQHLKNEIRRGAESLENLSVSLLKLELANNEDISAQLLEDLAQANQRMHDLLRARDEVKG
jgi:hypothetical protein